MVKLIADYQREGDKGKFMSLELMGDIELIQSANTGRFYATAKKCFISSTFDEDTAKSFVGNKLPGEINRVQCEAYNYTIQETGEVISLAHTYTYVPEAQKQAVIAHKEFMEMAS